MREAFSGRRRLRLRLPILDLGSWILDSQRSNAAGNDDGALARGAPVGEPAGVQGPGSWIRKRAKRAIPTRRVATVWLIVSPPDAKWKAPYSARFHVGASAPGG
jgi:hypothetical protein